MYLVITEDGYICTHKKPLTEGMFLSADAGILDIIDVVGDKPLSYYLGDWNSLSEYEECGLTIGGKE